MKTLIKVENKGVKMSAMYKVSKQDIFIYKAWGSENKKVWIVEGKDYYKEQFDSFIEAKQFALS